MADIEQGNSPCAYYYQEADKSDLGTWRVPNEVELIIMCGSLFDWHNPEKKEVYEFGNDLPSLGVVESEVLHSRTGFSKRSMNGARSFSAGYQMYLHGYLRWVTTVDTQWAGDNDRLVNNRKGYVRCVTLNSLVPGIGEGISQFCRCDRRKPYHGFSPVFSI